MSILTSPLMEQCECSPPNNTSGDEDESETTRPITSNVGEGAMGNNGIAVGAALGGVSAILLLILMGVIMGWVCTCYKAQHRYENPSSLLPLSGICVCGRAGPGVWFVGVSLGPWELYWMGWGEERGGRCA